MVYVAPAGHWCDMTDASGPVGSVWQCGTCGAYWRYEPISLTGPPGWYWLRGIALWRWKRRHREAS